MIYVPAGTYDEVLDFSGKANVEMYGAGDSTVINWTGSNDYSIHIDGASSDLVLHDFKIKQTFAHSASAITVSSLATGHFYNINFQDVGFTAINVRGPVSQFTTVISGIEINNCDLGVVGDFGIYVGSGVSGVHIHDIDSWGCLGLRYPPHAIYLQDCTDILVEDVYSEACGTDPGSVGNGFAYKAGMDVYGYGHISDIRFVRCVSVDCWGGLWFVDADDLHATDCDFLGNTNKSVQFYSVVTNSSMVGCTFSADTASGAEGIVFVTGTGNADYVTLTSNSAIAPLPSPVISRGAATNLTETGNSWN